MGRWNMSRATIGAGCVAALVCMGAAPAAGQNVPCLHLGQAATIEEMLTACNPDDEHGITSDLTEQELCDPACYVLSL